MAELKFKIPPVRIPSDDCIIHTGRETKGGVVIKTGTPHPVHTGEWVDLIPVGSIKQYLSYTNLSEVGKEDLQEIDEATPEGKTLKQQVIREKLDRLEQTFRVMCEQIASKVVGWNWTDLEGNPLSQPYKNVDVIMDLNEEEVAYLAKLAQGKYDVPARRKNASRPSSQK